MSSEQPDTPRPPWRPTKYDESYCDKAIEWGRLGKSRTWIAAELGVCKQTLVNWENAHPDFLAALTRAKALEQQWWEDAGQNGMTGDKFNGQVWGRSMAARFPDDWREKSEVDQNVKVQVTEIKRTVVDPRNPDA
jgi:hypothetical protein